MATIYKVTATLSFDNSTTRDSAYTRIKAALPNVKALDAWVSGTLEKSQVTTPDTTSETV
jgi:hypothetical protein